MKSNFLASALLLAFLAGPAVHGGTTEWWVAPGGSARHDGSAAEPMTSVSTAMEMWTAQRKPADSLRVLVREGVYFLTRPIEIPVDGGATPASQLSIEAAPGEHPVLCGGVTIGPWAQAVVNPPELPANARGQVWVANAPLVNGSVLTFRQLWVDDVKAVRAREPNDDHLARLVAWDKTNQIATIPAGLLPGLGSPAGVEMVVDQVWEIAVLRIAFWEANGSNLLVHFKQPESQIEFAHPWPPVIVKPAYQAPFYLVNALQFLDSPGEWFEDGATGKVYYWPRAGEDMTRARVIAPALETLVQAEGSASAPVQNLHFKGIAFADTTWMRPSEQGHVPLQAGMYMLDARKLSPKGTSYHPKLDNVAWIGRPPAAVRLRYARNVTFDDCTFEHLASAGLDIDVGCRDVSVQGCTFRDVGGNGLQLGLFSDPQVETHRPYNPADDGEVCARVDIRDNVITDCGAEDWGCPGIAAGYVRNVTITHNEIYNLPYTGISLGWGWTKMTNAMRDNAVTANHIHHVGLRLGDLGGIYTLSAQPGTVVAENSIEDIVSSAYVPDPDHWFYLYTDEGSSGITLRDNWCPAAKFLKNANGPGNVWLNNGPQVSAQIKAAAGLEPNFRYLLK